MKNYKDMKNIYPDFTTEIKSTKKVEIYARLGQAPQMKEWLDERAPKGLGEFGFTVVNKHYEASIAVDMDDLDDDQYGQIKIRATQLA
jgi:phage major head subunit gpT-like protein